MKTTYTSDFVAKKSKLGYPLTFTSQVSVCLSKLFSSYDLNVMTFSTVGCNSDNVGQIGFFLIRSNKNFKQFDK